MEDAKQAYHAFNTLWSKVPRHVRVDRENHQRMLAVRAYFDAILEAATRAAIVHSALATTSDATAKGGMREEEPEPDTTPIHLALRLLRTLSRREWEMVKAIVDLHKFSTEDFLDILDEIRDVHCARCGEWLDDDDEHENCPVPEEEDEEGIPETSTTSAPVAVSVPAPSTPSEEAPVLAMMPKPNE